MTLAPDNIIAIRQRVRGSLHDLMMDVEREGDTELRAVLAVIISAPGDPIRVAVQPPKAKRVEMVEWFRKRMAGRVSS